MNEIIIIGTEPPCPRCGLLTHSVTEIIKEFNIDARVTHLDFTDAKAKKFAKEFDLTPGTAKDVARKTGQKIDKIKLSELLNKEPDPANEYAAYNQKNWSIELDEFLRPFERKAKGVGILMTPVLVINGELKHSGSVPGLGVLEGWLTQLK